MVIYQANNNLFDQPVIQETITRFNILIDQTNFQKCLTMLKVQQYNNLLCQLLNYQSRYFLNKCRSLMIFCNFKEQLSIIFFCIISVTGTVCHIFKSKCHTLARCTFNFLFQIMLNCRTQRSAIWLSGTGRFSLWAKKLHVILTSPMGQRPCESSAN